MDIQKLFKIQTSLDLEIIKTQGLEGANLVDKKILALQVELGELANETRCFKFWSKKPSSPREVILGEFVDCLHFILSIGIDSGFSDVENIALGNPQGNASKQFEEVFLSISQFVLNKTKENYVSVFKQILQLAAILNLTWEEVFKSYMEKNEINYQRQRNGY